MMKSQPSAIKLRLSRLVRCLLALGCLKLIIMGVALVDIPMPSWNTTPKMTEEKPAPVAALEITGKANAELTPQDDVQETKEDSATAAELAALAKPRQNPLSSSILPAPIFNNQGESAPGAFTPKLPTPPALGLPLAKAGIILPQTSLDKKEEGNIWDVLTLTSLPIPGLGSAQAAHAAALDMPVPATPQTRSPFTPAEQIEAGKMGGTSSFAPQPDGAPLPPRQYQGANAGFTAPAPNIIPQTSPLDPNVKNQELARQQQDLLMLRQQMDQRLKDLESAEGKMKEMLKEANNIEDQKVRNLIQMYSNMKPRMAAQAMEKMDERIAVRILSGMAPKQSGEILTYTNPAKTAKFTEMITRLKMMQ